MRLFTATFIVLFVTVSAASDVNEEAEELLTFLFQNAKYFPRDTPVVRSEKYPEVGLTAVCIQIWVLEFYQLVLKIKLTVD